MGIVAHNRNYSIATDEAKKSGQEFAMYFVHPAPYDGIARFLKTAT